MTREDLLHELFNIAPPWQIVRVRDDLGKHQIDLWVGHQEGKGGWFFGARTAAVRPDREQVGRPINLGDTRCVIHAGASPKASALHWQGEKGLLFTHAMSRLIVANDARRYQAAKHLRHSRHQRRRPLEVQARNGSGRRRKKARCATSA